MEVIGGYTVHPAASLFPLADEADAEFDELMCSIRNDGQLLPILVQGKMLLDGRNRLRACLKLDYKPKIQEYTGPLEPARLIADLNLCRRDLTEDVRTVIEAQINKMLAAERRAKQQAQGERGAEGAAFGAMGGRGKKNPLPANSSEGGSVKKTPAPDARKQVAAAAKVSEHKAQQAIDVVNHAPPEVVEKVKRGQMRLREAAAVAKEQKIAKHQAVPTPGKRQEIRQQAAKRRMIDVVSQIRGMCRGVKEMNIPLIAAALDDTEYRAFAAIGLETSRVMRGFTRRLKEARQRMDRLEDGTSIDRPPMRPRASNARRWPSGVK
jgi:hypothetical protein